jgi:hypothetical protein
VVEVGHNSLAVLGLTAVGVVLFFSGDSALRQHVERQALEWLHVRHNLASASGTEAEVNILADLSEPDAVARATASNPSALTRQQALVASWLARRYRVAPEPIARLVQEAWVVGKKANLDPTVILAIMAIESSFNPFAQSHVGAQGLMQVMTHVHDDKYEAFGGRFAAFDPVTNLRVGVQVLSECIARAGGGLEAGLKYYVGAANLPDDGGYAERVMTEHGYLRNVAGGQSVPLNAPLLRSAGSMMAAAGSAAPSQNSSSNAATVTPSAAAAESGGLKAALSSTWSAVPNLIKSIPISIPGLSAPTAALPAPATAVVTATASATPVSAPASPVTTASPAPIPGPGAPAPAAAAAPGAHTVAVAQPHQGAQAALPTTVSPVAAPPLLSAAASAAAFAAKSPPNTPALPNAASAASTANPATPPVLPVTAPAAADAEPRPAKAKTETAAGPAAASAGPTAAGDGRVAALTPPPQR